uniref:Uncharacterized protein n=1 Tax=Arundo donax TaxID=35708 RepID=A0A0A9GKM1_ARUDO
MKVESCVLNLSILLYVYELWTSLCDQVVEGNDSIVLCIHAFGAGIVSLCCLHCW